LPNDCSILNTSDQEVIKSTIKRVHLAPKMRWTSILVFETLKTKCMAKKVVGVGESRGVGDDPCSQNVLHSAVPWHYSRQTTTNNETVLLVRSSMQAWNWDSCQLVPRDECLPCYLYVNHWLMYVVMCGWIYLFRHSPSYGMT
jgi:hypothetical protein